MRLLSRMNSGQTVALVRTLAHPWDTRSPARCRVRVEWESVLLDPQPSLLTLRRRYSVLVRMIHRYYAAVRLLGDVHVGRAASSLRPPTCSRVGSRCLRGLPVLVHEVSRRAMGSSTTPDRTGTRAIAPVHVAFRALQRRRRPDCIFSELNAHPAYSPVYASPCTSRCPTQNSGSSGSLLLSREKFSFSASCRFSPAHCNGDISAVRHEGGGGGDCSSSCLRT